MTTNTYGLISDCARIPCTRLHPTCTTRALVFLTRCVFCSLCWTVSFVLLRDAGHASWRPRASSRRCGICCDPCSSPRSAPCVCAPPRQSQVLPLLRQRLYH